jgi:hypothetical protein
MSAATAHDANPFLRTAAAVNMLVDLRRATDGRTGDRLSGAIRAVTTAGSSLPPDEVDAAIAAIALLLSHYDPALLDGAADEQALRGWLHHVDTELTPGRRLAAAAALSRIELSLNNQWYEAHERSGTLPQALSALHRLRDELTDAASG